MDTDAEAASRAISVLPSHQFVLARFPEAEHAQSEGKSRDDINEICARLDKSISSVYDALPSRTLAVFMTGQGDMSGVKRMMARQAESRRFGSVVVFGEEEQRGLMEEIERARKGHVAMVIKN